jgi:hypothetical protein
MEALGEVIGQLIPIPMKIKIARHISPAAIAIALFFAVALLAHGATLTPCPEPGTECFKHDSQH